jgi:hypothetical protein
VKGVPSFSSSKALEINLWGFGFYTRREFLLYNAQRASGDLCWRMRKRNNVAMEEILLWPV